MMTVDTKITFEREGEVYSGIVDDINVFGKTKCFAVIINKKRVIVPYEGTVFM